MQYLARVGSRVGSKDTRSSQIQAWWRLVYENECGLNLIELGVEMIVLGGWTRFLFFWRNKT